MKQLSGEAQALIAQMRQLDDPTLADRMRLRERLDASWAATSAAPHVGASLVKAKLLLSATSFVAMAGTGLWLATTNPASTTKPAAPTLVLQPAATVASDAPAPPSPEPAPETPSAVALTREAVPARTAWSARSSTSAPAPASTLARASTPASARSSTSAPAPASTLARASTPASARASTPASARASTAAPASASAAGLASAPARASTPASEFAPARVSAATSATANTRASGSSPSSAPRKRTNNALAQIAEESAPAQPASAAITDPSRSQLTPAATEPPPKRIAAEPPAAIGDEVALLGAAQKELRAGQPTRALGFIQQHAFRFPTGALAQERAAVQALALCALNRKTAARQVFEDLARRAPSAAVLPRIRRDCDF